MSVGGSYLLPLSFCLHLVFMFVFTLMFVRVRVFTPRRRMFMGGSYLHSLRTGLGTLAFCAYLVFNTQVAFTLLKLTRGWSLS